MVGKLCSTGSSSRVQLRSMTPTLPRSSGWVSTWSDICVLTRLAGLTVMSGSAMLTVAVATADACCGTVGV